MEKSTLNIDGKKIILGVSGGIAAYKCAEIVRLFKKGGAEVRVVMTNSASRFITPLTLGTLAESEVLTEIFPENEEGSWTKHVNLGLWADLYVLAPATAHTIAVLANGLCDSMLAAVALSARCPLLVCPSMDHDMYIHPSTQSNLEKLESYGYHLLEPGHGELASGLVGKGRLPEPDEIFTAAAELLINRDNGALAGKTVLVTAGPTVEAIDPVRFISNRSTGTMGYAIAAAARSMGASVTLVTGPTMLQPPADVEVVHVESAKEMHEAVLARSKANIVVMAAAVADFTPAQYATSKIKKENVKRESSDSEFSLELQRTSDILKELGSRKSARQILVGFALETDNGKENAMRKLASKNLDMIVLNNPNDEGAGFGTSTNHVQFIFSDGRSKQLPLLSKREVAYKIFEHIQHLISAST